MKSITTIADALDAFVEDVEERVRQLAPMTGSRWMRRSDSPLPLKAIRAAVRAGKITASRVGKVVMLDRAEHDAWIAEHQIRTSAANDASAADNDMDDLDAAFGFERAVRAGR